MVKPGFGVYLPHWFPEPKTYHKLLEILDECVDFYEIGIPSPKPKYDGPVIRAVHTLLASKGIPLGLNAVEEFEEAPSKLSIVLAYLEDLGADNLTYVVKKLGEKGYSSLLLPDLAFEYPSLVENYVNESRRHGLKPSFFASSKFPHKWLRIFREYEPLFVYLGLQPATGVKLPISVERNVGLARTILGDDVALVVGFSAHYPELIKKLLEAGADAIVVGSEILRRVVKEGIYSAKATACKLYDVVHHA